jgi:3-methyl-2-oxobutanoate hydroxymethyltransferase
MKSVLEFQHKKQQGQKITMITCYDYTSACIVEKTQADCVLVGDSAAMVMHGETNTIQASIEQIAMHTRSVAKGINNKLIVADMPFLSYRKSLSETMEAVNTLLCAGAQAIKLEGVQGNLETITHIVESGVPVMGHIGLTPQHIHTLGGFKVQGKGRQAQSMMVDQARLLEASGCFSLVLECIPMHLAKAITEAVTIPTIGIGAGPDTDGQVLVFHDLLGLQSTFKPKFVKSYLNGEALFVNSINQYVEEVQGEVFPSSDYAYQGDLE